MVKNPTLGLALAVVLAACAHKPPPAPSFQGLVEFDERVLAFDVGGRVRSLNVVRGQVIREGEVVARLDDSLDLPTRAARVADLEAARAQLALLQAGSRPEDIRGAAEQLRATRESEQVIARVLTRQQGLVSSGSVAPSTLDDLENQLVQVRGQRDVQTQRLAMLRRGSRPEEIAAASARVEAARAAIDAIDARLQHDSLPAPAGGVVLDVPIKSGEVVAPGTPVATLGDIDHPYVDVFVPQQQIGIVHVGVPAHIHIDTMPGSIEGQVEHVADQTEFTPRYLFSERERSNLVVRVRVRVMDPAHRLRAGVPAFVTFGGAR